MQPSQSNMETSRLSGPEEQEQPGIRTAYLVFGIVALGVGVNVNGGNISLLSIACLFVSILAVITAFFRQNDANAPQTGFRPVWAVIFVGAVFQFFMDIKYPFGNVMYIKPPLPLPYVVAFILFLTLLLAVMVLKHDRAIGKWMFPFCILTQLILGILLLSIFPKPGIDVLRFQDDAARALLQGVNPYTIRFPDLYPPAFSAKFYAPGLSVNGILQFGYPYLPLTLFLSLPGCLLGDVRYASLIAMSLAGLLIAYARPGRMGKIAGLFLLFTPIFPVMLYLAWTESFVILMLAVVWFCHKRARRFLPYAVGLFLVSKQYMILIAPLTILLLPRPWNARQIFSFAWRACLAGVIVTLPLVLWDIEAFLKSAVFLQFHQPFRWDAMSLLVLARPDNPSQWVWLPFLMVGAALVVILWTGLRRTVSFPLAMGITLLLFFAFNKQAFANYYYLVTGALCCALADETVNMQFRKGAGIPNENMPHGDGGSF